METIYKVGAIVIQDGKFFVVRKRGKDIWTSLGGRAEVNETEEETLRRECLEEVRCEIEIVRKLGDFKDKAVFDDAEVHLAFYVCHLRGVPKVIDNELEECAFIPQDWKEQGIQLPSSLENQVIPLCIKEGLLLWK